MFVKLIQDKAYFKRYQTKFRRRREGKTDYRQRHKLITQDKNKYNAPKFRFVVRFSNKFVTCQVIYAQLEGDVEMCRASSAELPKYGVKVGLKNYSAAYCTGLLCARRLLQKVKLDSVYAGNDEPDGTIASTKIGNRTFFVEEVDDDKKPFRCYLDIGIKNTTTGARIFGALKGASDGGLDIPHNEKRFPGYTRDTKSYDADTHRARIFGEHVADYMRELEEDDEEHYKTHFARYLEEDISADDIEEMYEKCHAAIREDPSFTAAPKFTGIDKSFKHPVKLTYDERKARAAAKKAEIRAKVHPSEDDAEEEE